MADIPEKKRRIVESTIRLILRHGYASTTVDEICALAGVTKGSFFHYFSTKEEACRAAMDAWSAAWQGILDAAGFEAIRDPRERVFHLLDVMETTYLSPDIDCGCVVGMVAQELALSNEGMRGHAETQFNLWLAGVTEMLEAVKRAGPTAQEFESASVARFMIGVVQGSMLVAKTLQDRQLIVENLRHLRAYLSRLL